MIPRAFITEWGRNAPWQFPEQVEQDLIISQALVKIYQEEFLASQLAFRDSREKHLPDSREFLRNLAEKVSDPDFAGDTKALLIPGEKYEPLKAFELLRTKLIDKI